MTALERPTARLEHRLTRPNASLSELHAAVRLAVENELGGLTVNPWLLRPAVRQLGASRLRLGTVVGDGHGGQISSVKSYEASKALEHGATQLDFVMNGGALVSGDDQLVLDDMLSVIEMAHAALATAGALGCFGITRREGLWAAGAAATPGATRRCRPTSAPICSSTP